MKAPWGWARPCVSPRISPSCNTGQKSIVAMVIRIKGGRLGGRDLLISWRKKKTRFGRANVLPREAIFLSLHIYISVLVRVVFLLSFLLFNVYGKERWVS